jgi:hypothetical protein
LESKRKTSNNVCSGHVEKVVPQNAGNIFAGGKKKSSDILLMRPINRGRDEEIFQIIHLVKCDLGIVRQSLLSLGAQHESLGLLSRHCRILGVHVALRRAKADLTRPCLTGGVLNG